MSDYTPTTGHVQDAYCHVQQGVMGERGDAAHEKFHAEFDRWLAGVERAAAEKAWDEGANAVTCEWRLHPERGDAIVKHAQVRTRRPANPYRKEQGSD